jgi:hypothetical protein
MFEVSSDIYFVVYNLYYVDQNDDLRTRVGPRNWNGGSTKSGLRIRVGHHRFIGVILVRVIDYEVLDQI